MHSVLYPPAKPKLLSMESTEGADPEKKKYKKPTEEELREARHWAKYPLGHISTDKIDQLIRESREEKGLPPRKQIKLSKQQHLIKTTATSKGLGLTQ